MNFFYGRVSTDDAQDPSLSIPRQLAACQQAIAPAGGEIISSYWDVESGRKALEQRGHVNEDARYFQVLVALCEPRLRDPASTGVPSVQQIADRLSELDGGAAVTRSAVGFHLEYLARYKLHVYEREDAEDPGARLDQRRHALVATALRFGLVTAEHRRLLGR